jgi:hypothetical protein
MHPPYREQNVPCDERTKSTEQKIMQAADRETQVTSISAQWCLFRYCLLGGTTGQFRNFVLDLRTHRVMENKKKTIHGRNQKTGRINSFFQSWQQASSFRHHRSLGWQPYLAHLC